MKGRRRAPLLLGVAALVAGAVWLARPRPQTALPRSALEPAQRYEAPLPAMFAGATPPAATAAEPAAAEAANNAFEKLIGPPRWHPRPDGEWQGMLVNLNLTPPCDTSALCGLARACKGGKCMPCTEDGDCAGGEGCALDHCVRRELVGCRRSSDCAPKSLCVLSGYSAEPRGNEGMRSFCLDPRVGVDSGSSPPPAEAGVDPRTSLPDDDLLKAAREAAHRND